MKNMRNRVRSRLLAMLLIFLAASLTSCGGGVISDSLFFIKRVSVGIAGAQATDNSYSPSINSDGRYVAFMSAANNLVAGDNNAQSDIFVHDRLFVATIRVSLDSSGTEANNGSNNPSIGALGRYVVFQSVASNLVAADTNGVDDIFAHDWVTGSTVRVSISSAAVQSNGASDKPSISSNGRYVAFQSVASNLVASDTNGASDIFVHDIVMGVTLRVSVGPAGVQANGASTNATITPDGRYVVFQSVATNLVAGDANGAEDIFVHDTVTGTTALVSVDSASVQANGASDNPAISSNGRYVAFRSAATNLVAIDANGADDIFVRDTVAGTTALVSVDSASVQANGASDNPSISTDGRYVVFQSAASNLVAADANGFVDIFIRDTVAGTTTLVSVNSAALQANDDSNRPLISSDGQYVAFESSASNLVNGDTLGFDDIFLVLQR